MNEYYVELDSNNLVDPKSIKNTLFVVSGDLHTDYITIRVADTEINTVAIKFTTPDGQKRGPYAMSAYYPDDAVSGFTYFNFDLTQDARILAKSGELQFSLELKKVSSTTTDGGTTYTTQKVKGTAALSLYVRKSVVCDQNDVTELEAIEEEVNQSLENVLSNVNSQTIELQDHEQDHDNPHQNTGANTPLHPGTAKTIAQEVDDIETGEALAGHAMLADKATNDEEGNNIKTTYATKGERVNGDVDSLRAAKDYVDQNVEEVTDGTNPPSKAIQAQNYDQNQGTIKLKFSDTDESIADLESKFEGDYAKKAKGDRFGNQIDSSYAHSLQMDSQTFKLRLVDINGVAIGSEIDLPIEQMIVNVEYNESTQSLVFTLDNGQTLTVPIGDLITGLVSNTLTIANISLDHNITAQELKTALQITISDITDWQANIHLVVSQELATWLNTINEATGETNGQTLVNNWMNTNAINYIQLWLDSYIWESTSTINVSVVEGHISMNVKDGSIEYVHLCSLLKSKIDQIATLSDDIETLNNDLDTEVETRTSHENEINNQINAESERAQDAEQTETARAEAVEHAHEVNIKELYALAYGTSIVDVEQVDDNFIDVRATPEAIKGSRSMVTKIEGKTQKWNQLVDPESYGSLTSNGITYTKNENGSITADGTSTAKATIFIKSNRAPFNLVVGHTYLLKGCPSGGSSESYYLKIQDTGYHSTFTDIGNGKLLTAAYENYYCWVAIESGQTVSNLIFYPNLIDLTENGDDSLTLEQAMAKYNGFYPYDSGSLKSASTSGVKTYDLDGVNFTQITFPKTELKGVGTAKDSVELRQQENGLFSLTKVQRTGHYTFTGNEPFIAELAGLSDYRFISYELLLDARNDTSDAIISSNDTCKSTYYEYGFQIYNTNFYIRNAAIQTVSDMQAYLSGKMLVYPLETPVETVIASDLTYEEVTLLMEGGQDELLDNDNASFGVGVTLTQESKQKVTE